MIRRYPEVNGNNISQVQNKLIAAVREYVGVVQLFTIAE